MLKPMKKVFFFVFAIAFIGLSLSSCKEDGEVALEGKSDTVVDTDYTDFKGESLKKHGINAMIMLPDELSNTGASVVPTFDRVEDYLWNIEMGPRFEMSIEDLGTEENPIARIKSDLENVGIFKIEYLVDEADLIMYSRTVKYEDNSDLEVKKTITYHCAGSKKIDGITYLIKSGKEGVGFPKLIIEDMVKTIRSFEKLDTES